MKILVVDDSKVARMYVIKSISSIVKDVEFFEASNGLEALEIFKKKSIDAVFLDLTMPVMDGYEALNHIMQINKNAQVIVVSADVQSEAKLRVLKAGAKNIYAKPIDDEKMKNIFENDLSL